MYFSGIADEAGRGIDTQIRAHKEIGWDHIELRAVGKENLTSVSDTEFDQICEQVAESGLQVSCFSSAIANWARPISGDVQRDIDDLKRAIPRMQRFGTKFIRVMSYPNDKDAPLDDKAWRDEAVRRMKLLAEIAEDGGVILAHENCSGWGGSSPENSLALLEGVDSPALQLLFDTGNPVMYGQDAWEYYTGVRDHVSYIHIKDGILEDDGMKYTYPGEGRGYVKEVLADLAGRGYNGAVSIEPHLAAVIHTGESDNREEVLYNSYVEYGKRLNKLAQEIM